MAKSSKPRKPPARRAAGSGSASGTRSGATTGATAAPAASSAASGPVAAPASGAPAGAASTSASTAAAPTGALLTVRHYCQGIGDCHLLKFAKDGGGSVFVLIDCGVHSMIRGGADKIAEIVDDIASVTTFIDVVVGTHEHWDHLSGFLTAAEQFKKITFGEVWLAWTENPGDPQAAQLDKFKGQALAALTETSRNLQRADAPGPHLAAVRDGLQSLLGFQFGAAGERVRAARTALVDKATKGVRYLEAKDSPLGLPGVGNVRVHVLGPPRDPKLLGLTDRTSEMYGIAGRDGWPLAAALGNAFGIGDGLDGSEDYAAPFDTTLGMDLSVALDRKRAPDDEDDESDKDETSDNKKKRKKANKLIFDLMRDHYTEPPRPPLKPSKYDLVDQSWRRIDMDWLGTGADLGIQLDQRTNNSSLVLAFEFDKTRVMLFAGDAQVGNWLSWQTLDWTIGDEHLTGPDLLRRTVFYKVGHHGSHNATLKEHGLELMTNVDLSAFIPTNQKDADAIGWHQMPFQEIVDELRRRCSGRVIMADDPWVAMQTGNAGFTPPSGAIKRLQHKAGLWVELDLA
jgi:hypothetical protein